jgi:hypothetical protein
MGVPAFSIEAMVTGVEQSGGRTTMKEFELPLGPGTVYKVFGKVQLLGNTIIANETTPLVFVVHNAANSDEAKASFSVSGRLIPVPFAISEIKLDKTHVPSGKGAPPPFLQLVHIGGTGVATLKDGRRLNFK